MRYTRQIQKRTCIDKIDFKATKSSKDKESN